MRLGFIGLGKLGLPVATTLAAYGHEVIGYDPYVTDFPSQPDAQERGWQAVIDRAAGNFSFDSLTEACRSEVVFVAVQTPHEPAYEGITPLPDERRDFDYRHLNDAVRSIRSVCDVHNLHPVVAVISTVLPGTMRREVIPRLGRLRLVYCPSFVAMGTVIADFTDPEFVLLGGDRSGREQLRRVYEQVNPEVDFREMSIESAELAKVAYNTFIGMKLAVVNTLAEICHRAPAPRPDVDEVTDALKAADRRLISPAYLTAGMGDGGGCHPRDQIALSWLARERDLSFDLFEAVMLQRQEHARWLAELMRSHGEGLPLGILGVAYKPRSALVTGSSALLVADLLDSEPLLVDPYVAEHNLPMPATPYCWLVGCRHPEFSDYTFPPGSVVIDPWRYIPDREGVEVVRVGEG